MSQKHGTPYNLGIGTGNNNLSANAPYNWQWSWYEWNGNLHDPGNLLVNASSGSGYNTGFTDFVIGIPDGLKWDPINNNACCITSGCLHPAAYNFDLAGYHKGYGPDPDNHDPNNPIYIGIGAQHDGSVNWTSSKEYLDGIPLADHNPPLPNGTPGSYTVHSGGQACTTCTSQNLINTGLSAYPPPGGSGNNGHFHTYFDGANGPRGLYAGISGIGTTPFQDANGNDVVGPFYPSDWDTPHDPGDPSTSGQPNQNSNPWHQFNPEWQCCVFPFNTNRVKQVGGGSATNDGKMAIGCTDIDACPKHQTNPNNANIFRFSKNGYDKNNAWTNDEATSIGTTNGQSDVRGCCYPDTFNYTGQWDQCAHCGYEQVVLPS